MSALDDVTSIKTKLGLLVAVSVAVAAVAGAAAGVSGVAWWLSVPVTVLLALTVTQLLAAGMVAPLREMTGAAAAMARGDWSRRVVTDNTDEVGQLARAFNAMALDLEQVDVERRDLIATVSHELRTPVTAMTAQLENLADGVVEATPERLEQVLGTAHRLADLVSDLLTLSRMEAGAVEIELGDVELADLVHQSAAEVRRAGREAEVSVEIDPDLVVRADVSRLRQLLVNGLDNAARHTAPGTPVRVLAGRGTESEQSWWLEVRDAGQGVAPEQRDRVFERFGTDSGGGTGLGLAIARWVATLHGGQLRFIDQVAGEPGARLRLDVDPAAVPAPSPQGPSLETRERLSTHGSARSVGSVGGSTDSESSGRSAGVLAGIWPESDGRPRPGLVGLTAVVGLLGAGLMTFHEPGLGWTLVLLAAGALAWSASRRRTEKFTLACSVLAAALVLMMTWTANEALAVLSVVAGAGIFLAGLTGARSFSGIILSGFSWPLSSLVGLPWFGRSLSAVARLGNAGRVVLTGVVSLGALVVFGALFASADQTFARWVYALLPDFTVGSWVLRLFVALFVFAATLAAVHLAVNPSQVDALQRIPARAGSRWEWLAPVLVIDLVFVVFLASQVRVVSGGHDYVRRTSGLTYAEYVHQGFGQLVVATLLTLIVVWAAARRASVRAEDRRPMLAACGLLGVLALGVVATAIGRMAVYQDAYGFTVLRVFVTVFEAWLGVVLVAVLILGARRRGAWMARFALLSGGAVLLALVMARPDAWVAERNIERYEMTGKLDLNYLGGLSTDAAGPVLTRLPDGLAVCVLHERQHRWFATEELPGPVGKWDHWQDWTVADLLAGRALEEAGLDGVTPVGPSLDTCADEYEATMSGSVYRY